MTSLATAASPTAALDPTTRRTAGARNRDRWFFTIAAAAAFAIVFGGFARTYYLKSLFSTPALAWLLHLHGALMTSWFVLYFVQTSLIAAHRVRVHRRLGIAGAVLAGLIVIVGAAVALHATRRDLHAPTNGGPPPLQALGFFFAVLLVFAILVGTALLLRRRRDWHKRLMLLSCVILSGPGLARITFERAPALAFLRGGGPGGLLDLVMLLVYACIAWDTWRNRRLHPAFVCGALLIAAVDLPFIWLLLSTPTWVHVATRLVS
ncbi:MAG TPA: hypothetical protein VN607_07860 [Gemmatimonadaceae bacterium]|nr:hypothetical protein [Gemmatimonadaceae bacterium]